MLRTLLTRRLIHQSTMAPQTATAASPFTKAVVDSMRKLYVDASLPCRWSQNALLIALMLLERVHPSILPANSPDAVRGLLLTVSPSYPEVLADKSFDNTGLLLEAPFDTLRRQMNSVLLTVDLTRAVDDEAIENKNSLVVAYHPIIFRGLKSLTLADSQQSSLLRLALEGISVYCPHTAVDAVPDGMTDWLCDIVSGKLSDPEPETHTAAGNEAPVLEEREMKAHPKSKETKTDDASSKETARPAPHLQRSYSKPTYPRLASSSTTDLQTNSIPHKRSVIHPSPTAALDAANSTSSSKPNPIYAPTNTGAGRLITFNSPQPLTHLVERIARGVGTPKGFPVAIPQSSSVEDIQIRTVGVCPGSGGSILRDCAAAGKGGLLFTGELTHHEALAVTEKGGCVVSLFHSNSERGYLHSVMKGKLEAEVRREWDRVRKSMAEQCDGDGASEDLEDVLRDENVTVEVSERDRDPYGIVILQASEQVGTKI
jgi:dinuclear metal center YbgI/SA1388 family protein